MNIQYVNDMPFVIIDDFFAAAERWFTLSLIAQHDLAKDTEVTGSAALDGKLLRNNSGCWAGQIAPTNTARLPLRPYLTAQDELIASQHWFWRYIRQDRGNVMYSHYTDGDSYGPHFDEAKITWLTWLTRDQEPLFTGGNLILEQGKKVIDFKDNRTVIFPSCMIHEVDEVKFTGESNGRFTITVFQE
jgi:hypothetical protein